MRRDPEKRLQHYVAFRSRHLSSLCAVVFVAVAGTAFYYLWDAKTLYPLRIHIEEIERIVTGRVTATAYLHALEVKGLVWPIAGHVAFSLTLGTVAALLATLPWMKRPDRMDWVYVREGSEVFDDPNAGVRALRKKVGAWEKRGIGIYRGRGGVFRLPYELEPKHILALGSVGSGKTATMLHAIHSIIERGDKAVIYDYKGDMTEWLGGREDVALVAFADERSVPWHIAKDIHSPLLARELAQTVIKETSEPVWGENARDVLGGAIEYLIVTKPMAWGFRDLSDMLKEDRRTLAEKLRSIGHGAANTIDKPKDDKGANSVMSTLRSGAWIFDVLAKVWGNPTEGFSVRGWLTDERPQKTIFILRNYPDISAVSNWLLSIIFNQMFGEVLALKDSKTRRVWAIIDELATLPAMLRLPECLVASRSKGFRFLCGIQNFASMRDKYGADVAQTIFSQFATRIVCRVSDADTATELAKAMGGDRRVSRAEVRRVKELKDNGETGMRWDIQWQDRVEPTILNNAIMNLPDPTETGCVTAWLYIAGFPIARLEWDFIQTEATAPIDAPVQGMDDRQAPDPEPEDDGPRKPKPFPSGGRLSGSSKGLGDLDDLGDLPDIGEL